MAVVIKRNTTVPTKKQHMSINLPILKHPTKLHQSLCCSESEMLDEDAEDVEDVDDDE